MEKNRWDRLRELFLGALERDTSDWADYLESACSDDPALRAEVVAMLAVHETSQGLQIENRWLMGNPVTLPEPDELVGTHIGPYRLERLIGQGGMGAVYHALRDDNQFEQEVALKLIRPGLHTSDVVARFRVERQILARLQHPNIARLNDGGLTQDGLPYLVMEYVEGTPITSYCDALRLPVVERLKLFQTVCRAVQYAHQNLVVHRDLKPSNILVSATGEIKLLDFGIAKLLDPDQIRVPLPLTRSEMRLLTPEYAAPEQVRGETITTATDVYALGVLLYELLTGHRPYQLPERRLAEVERIICEEEPTRPSAIISRIEEIDRSDGTREVLTPERISGARGVSFGRLRRVLEGDLDNILMTALRKEPDRRYSSAEMVAQDIGRHLQGVPVTARKETVLYRIDRFVKRHRLGVAVACLIFLLLAGFGIVTALQAQRIGRERDVARSERDRAAQALRQAEEVSGFLMGLFEANDPRAARGATVTALDLLERGVARTEELADQPAVQARMLGVMGRVYRGIGRYDTSRVLLERSVDRWRSLNDPAGLISSLNHLGLLLLDQGEFAKADQLFHEVRQIMGRQFATDTLLQAENLHNLGGLAFEQGEYAAADSLFRAAADLRRRLLGEQHDLTIGSIQKVAACLERMDRFREAEPIYRRVLELRRSQYGDLHPDVAIALNDLALLLKKKGDLAEAGNYYRESLAMRRKLYGDAHPRVAITLVNYAKLLMEMDTYPEAEGLLTEAVSIFRTAYGADHPDVAWALESLSRTYSESGALQKARTTLREVISIQRRTLGTDHPRLAASMISLANTFMDTRQYDEAQRYFTASHDIYRKAYGERHPETALALLYLARLNQERGRMETSGRLYRRALAIYREVLPEGHVRLASALINYGEWLMEQGKPQQAETLLREGLHIRQKVMQRESPLLDEARGALGICLALMERFPEAEPLLAAALDRAPDELSASLLETVYSRIKKRLEPGRYLRNRTAFELGRRRSARGDGAGAASFYADAAILTAPDSSRTAAIVARARQELDRSLLASKR